MKEGCLMNININRGPRKTSVMASFLSLDHWLTRQQQQSVTLLCLYGGFACGSEEAEWHS
ncbi:hypothetical protein HispidOSU_031040 [Sigmodon hispidus]